MTTAFVTAAEMQAQLGGIPLERIRMVPPPGLATEEDLLRVLDSENRTCELVDGVLVEKTSDFYAALVTAELCFLLGTFLETHDLGIVLGSDGAVRILDDQILAPDVAFYEWRHFPDRLLPAEPVPALAPDLAVDVLSAGNTGAEMERRLNEYFTAGVKLVWLIDPASESATVYEDRHHSRKLTLVDSLIGGRVLPEFDLPLKQLFEGTGFRSGGQQ